MNFGLFPPLGARPEPAPGAVPWGPVIEQRVPLRPKVDLPRRLRQKNKWREAFVGAQQATASLGE
jgi:hypothetical protein